MLPGPRLTDREVSLSAVRVAAAGRAVNGVVEYGGGQRLGHHGVAAAVNRASVVGRWTKRLKDLIYFRTVVKEPKSVQDPVGTYLYGVCLDVL